MAKEEGIAPALVLADTGLAEDELQSPQTLTSGGQFLIAVGNVLNGGGSPALAIRVARKIHLSSFGMLGFALLCADTLGRANELAVKYQELADPVLPLSLSYSEDAMSWVYPGYAIGNRLGVSEAVYRFLVEFRLVVHVITASEGVGRWCVPVKARFAWSAPHYESQLAEALQCPLEFNASMNAVDYPLAWRDFPSPLADRITAAQMAQRCAKLLRRYGWNQPYSARVHSTLMASQGKFPSLEDVARNLCMSSRTLHRKLRQEEASFSEILADVRRSRAMEYLQDPSLSVSDIADRLGFSDSVAFSHAFRQWTQTTPSRFRNSVSR